MLCRLASDGPEAWVSLGQLSSCQWLWFWGLCISRVVETRCAMQHDGLHDGGCWVFESGVDGPPMISERISHHFGALHLESLFWQVHTISTVDLAGWISLSKHSLGGSNPGPSQDQDRLECGPMSLKHIQTHGPNFQQFPTFSNSAFYVRLCPSQSSVDLNLALSTWHCQLDTVNLTPSLLRS